MPTLPPGTGQCVNPAVTPTWVFTPNTSATAIVRLANTGRNTVYVGQSQMTQNNSMPIPPGGKPVELIGVTQTLYALSGVIVGTATVAGTLSAASSTVGSTAVTLAATVATALAAGTTIIIGSTAGTGWEAQVVNSTTASSQLTFTSALVQDHAASSPVYTVTEAPAQVSVIAGVL